MAVVKHRDAGTPVTNDMHYATLGDIVGYIRMVTAMATSPLRLLAFGSMHANNQYTVA